MRKAVLVEAPAGQGKSTSLHSLYVDLLKQEDISEVYSWHPEDKDTFIYVLESSIFGKIIINSGADTYGVIADFDEIIKSHPDVSLLYTAIRPADPNRNLHAKMKRIVDSQSFEKQYVCEPKDLLGMYHPCHLLK